MIYEWPGLKTHCIYDVSLVQLIIGKIYTAIDFKVGVKQVNGMEPVLFLLLFIEFSKTLEDEWNAPELIKAQFSCKENSPISTRQLVIHQPVTFTSGTLFDIFCMIYVEDSAFGFKCRNYIERGITLLSDHFARIGLKMHIGTGKNSSKTECIFFPPPCFFNTRTSLPTHPTNSTLSLQGGESEKQRHTWVQRINQVQRIRNHQSERIIRHLHQALHVLGDIHLLLSQRRLQHWRMPNIRKYINGSPSKVLVRHQRQQSHQVPHIPCHTYQFIPGGMWELRNLYIPPKTIGFFLHCSTRRILGINITEVKEQHITNESARKKFFDIPNIKKHITTRQLTFIGKVACYYYDQILTKLLTTWCNQKRKHRGVLNMNKK